MIFLFRCGGICDRFWGAVRGMANRVVFAVFFSLRSFKEEHFAPGGGCFGLHRGESRWRNSQKVD